MLDVCIIFRKILNELSRKMFSVVYAFQTLALYPVMRQNTLQGYGENLKSCR